MDLCAPLKYILHWYHWLHKKRDPEPPSDLNYPVILSLHNDFVIKQKAACGKINFTRTLGYL